MWGAVWRGALLILAILALDAFWLEPSSIRVVQHQIAFGRHGVSPLRGLRIAVITDLHAGAPYIDERKIETIVHLALGLRPDLVLLAGDYVTQGVIGRTDIPVEKTASLLKPLRARLGVFAVLGNHDHWADANRISLAFRKVGIQVLMNESVQLKATGPPLYLVGIGDHVTAHDNVPLAFRGMPKSVVALCFTHSPDVFPDLPPACGLTVAGHTHGGQVNLPIVGRLIVPSRFGQRYAAGLIAENGRLLFVSTGIGTSILPVRFRVPPEISLLEIR
ncbi:MAG: metallophosphoesterase [Alphaproteobacteria bacterium]